MPRLHLGIVLFFLVAIGSNCLQVGQISFDSPQSSDTAIGASNSSNKTADSDFLVADDDRSDDVLYGSLPRSGLPALNADSAPFVFHLTYLNPVSFSRHAILKI
jgi:hypothetical protein